MYERVLLNHPYLSYPCFNDTQIYAQTPIEVCLKSKMTQPRKLVGKVIITRCQYQLQYFI